MLLKTFASHVLPFRHKPFFHLSPSIPGFAALSVALFLVCLFASQWKSVLLTGIVFPTYFSWKCLNIDDIKEVLNLFCDHANKQKVSWSLLATAYPHLRRDTDAACLPKGGKQLCSFASPRVPTSIDRHSFTWSPLHQAPISLAERKRRKSEPFKWFTLGKVSQYQQIPY